MRAGEHVTPQVRLVRPIGSGGMGSVWVADHLALKTQVAVKFILAGRENDSEARERFSREAEAAAQVKSPHVTQIFDHGVAEDGVPFIVMELLEGEDLARFVHAHGRVDLRQAASIIEQVCRALARAHAKGLIHRDVKPANIFLCDVGTKERFVKLLDFGVAKVIGDASATKSGAVTGTPLYMAPEQLLGAKDLDHRADLWSVAVVAYELMTGRRPMGEDETAAAIALRVHTRGMPRATDGMLELTPAATDAIDAWFDKAWAIDPNARFQSALELAESFAALVQKIHDEQGVAASQSYQVAIDRLSIPGEGTSRTVREIPGNVSSDQTLESGRVQVLRVQSSGKSVIKMALPATEDAPPSAASPKTETPISRQVQPSDAPPVVAAAPQRGRFIAIAMVFVVTLAGAAIVMQGRRPTDARTASSQPPIVPASSTGLPVVAPSTNAAPSTTVSVVVAPSASVSITPPAVPAVVASTKPVAPVKSAAPAKSAAPSTTTKPLLEIE